MGKAVSLLLRPIKTFNIENRAHRLIGREKPKAAPRYASNIKELERAKEATPDFLEKHYKKDPGLDDRLKDVYVRSQDPYASIPEPVASRYNPDRPLPQDRVAVPLYEFGLKEPDVVPPGRITLRHALIMISENQGEPDVNTAEVLAEKYNLNVQDVADIVKYVSTFTLFVPGRGTDIKETRVAFAGVPLPVAPRESTDNPIKKEILDTVKRITNL